MMSSQLDDTPPEEEKALVEWLQKKTPAQRLELGLSLTQANLEHIREDIRQANPNASKEELDLIFVEVNYGKELADRVRTYLARRRGAIEGTL
jgi:hypothetical protein